MKLTVKTTKGTRCSPCPLLHDCNRMREFTLCELLNISSDEIIEKIIITHD